MKTYQWAAALAALLMAPSAFGAQFLSSNDFVIAIDTDQPLSLSSYPAAEAPFNAIDGLTGTKYLNFGKLNTGIMVQPFSGASTIHSMLLTTANDAVERDPASWAIYGTNENVDLAAADNGTSLIANWQLIAQGNVAMPAARLTAGPVLSFANTTAYSTYRVLFPTVKNATTANSMQVAEIGLFASNDATGTSIVGPADQVAAFQLPAPDSRYNAGQEPRQVLDGTGPNLTLPSQSSYPANEAPPLAVDGTTAKYLNFGREDSGFIVTPAGGPSTVRSFQLTTANDAVERDPATWQLFGTNQPIASADNSYGLGESWTMIASGDVALPPERNTLGPVVPVTNSTQYASYKLLFPTVKDGATANSMQIAEASFFSSTDGSGTDILNAGDAVKGVDGTVRTGLDTKYLNFGKNNSGLIITPTAGAKVLTGFKITTGDDLPERDPAQYQLYGTNSPVTSTDNGRGDGETWTLISSGDLSLPTDRKTESALIPITNSTSYTSYRLIFPTVREGAAAPANSLQFAGLQFFDNSVAKAADFDDDGDVDGNDFVIWQKNVGATGATKAMGDATGDGNVNAADLAQWRTQYHTAVAAVGAVPEPAAVALAGMALAGLAMRGRRRREK